MSNKKGEGETSSLSFFIGMIIMILMLVALGVIGYILAQQNVDVRARVTFDHFLNAYQNCTSVGVTDCSCGDFDFTTLPGNYVIRVTKLEDSNLGFDLLKKGEQRIHAETTGNGICTYAYSQETDSFVIKDAPDLTFTSGSITIETDLPRTSTSEQLRSTPSITAFVRTQDHLCFAWESVYSGLLHPGSFEQTLEFLHNRMQPCTSKLQSLPFSRSGLLQLAHHSGTAPPLGYPSNDIKTFETSLQNRLLQLTPVYTFDNTLAPTYETLNAVYPSIYARMTKPDFGATNYLISFRLDVDTQGTDHIALRYLETSPSSKLLAQSIKDGIIRFSSSDILVQLEPVKDEPLSFFDGVITRSPRDDIFVLDNNYGLAYTQRHELPAVFLDFVEHTREHPFLQSNFDPISLGIAEGIKTYLSQYPSTPQPESTSSGELFESPQTI